MSKKISLKKLAQIAGGSKGASPAVRSSSAAKGITIGEKRPRVEVPDIMPTKKGKLASDGKGKGPLRQPKRIRNLLPRPRRRQVRQRPGQVPRPALVLFWGIAPSF
ncbi:hypothetical protein Acr_03g0009690 [Actinidia rufa]|uniref:Uncharacterized protein n=1 Tax=Actinidia rufa TaxID=165716 RepID=A0A7J0ECM9_9ERIC|nr:hypothetical protein Acr_03g0009690 [Actinidia rufa]